VLFVGLLWYQRDGGAGHRRGEHALDLEGVVGRDRQRGEPSPAEVADAGAGEDVGHVAAVDQQHAEIAQRTHAQLVPVASVPSVVVAFGSSLGGQGKNALVVRW